MSQLDQSQWASGGVGGGDASSTPRKGADYAKAVKTIEAYLQDSRARKEVVDAWKRVLVGEKGAIREGPGGGPGDATEVKAALARIEKSVGEIKNKVNEVPKGQPASWAGVVMRGTGVGGVPGVDRVVEVPRRAMREIVVKAGEETPAERSRSGKDLVEGIQKAGIPGVVAARRLQSGDIVATLDSTERQAKALKEDWKTVLGTGAAVKRREYGLLAHGIRVVEIQNQAESIKALKQANPAWGEVEILRIGWAHSTIRREKRFAPLQVFLGSPSDANRIIDHGLLWECELHDCEPFIGDCRVTQCFNCQGYGHMATRCSKPTRCGYCAKSGHKSNDCQDREKKEKHNCAVCGLGHVAWDRNCVVRKVQVNRAREAYDSRPTRFRVWKETQPQPKIDGILQRSVTPSVQTRPNTEPNDADVFTEENTRITRRAENRERSPLASTSGARRGRPPLGPIREAGSENIRNMFTKRTRTRTRSASPPNSPRR